MTISLDRAAANLRNHHEVNHLRREENSCLNPSPLEPEPSLPKGVPSCHGSPSRSSTSSRTRSRTPSPPQSSHTSRQQSSLKNGNKVSRSISPGGTAASSAPDVSRRGVRFANLLVTAVYTRPRTPLDQRAKLFYSRSDEIRFREEAAYACDDDWLDQLEEDSLPDENAYSSPEQPHHQQQRTTYSISKAVVVFGSTTRTYGGGCAVEAALKSEKAFSFDDDAFWSGQLTWS
mmetsp:Transcript_1980/g.3255  ORF Transcript_1980/g.3255 Transcript_1980/m.3255 type:complete len:232 (-) Transcript_1980:194-889(-)